LEFYRMLENHDWYHQFSDDGRAFLSGEREESRLKSIAAGSPERKALFDSYHHYVWKGGNKPAKPLF